ncbi:MAG: uroporphyrinogen decarboxylase [Chloroflexi bacterium]|nr:MAG: uroporphyrinogen decarboxylase [Chloroflexota bacterium]
MRVLQEPAAPGRENPALPSPPPIVRAARCQPVERTPVWFMRQAGRSLPEYRAVRERHDIFSICRNPELCAQVSLQPVSRLGVDGAVLFADIMLPIAFGLGVDLKLVEDVGPVIDRPIRSAADVEALRATPMVEAVPFVLEAIRILRREVDPAVGVIGFSGAPFTLAGYLIEGKPSRDFLRTKSMMYSEPRLWGALMDRLTEMVLDYLRAQAAAGAHLVQLFDSWVGTLSAADYQEFAAPWVTRIFDGLRSDGIPAIHFGTGNAALIPAMRDAGGDVIGLDWRVDLGATWKHELGYTRGVQGNLEPAAMLGPWSVIESKAKTILKSAAGRPGHIFNLGHGVLPATPVEHLQRLVELVHAG